MSHADELDRVFTVCPTYRKFINDESVDPKATRDNWIRILSQCELADVRAVVDDIVNGKESPKEDRHDPKDQLPYTIAARARNLAGARRDIEHNRKLQEAGTNRGAWAHVAKTEIGHLAITCGAMSRDGAITREENKQRMEDLFAWQAGSGRPEWIDEAIAWSRRNERANPFKSLPTPRA